MAHSDIIYLDVGSQIFRTTKATLSQRGGFFERLVNGPWAESLLGMGTKEYPLFIDRDPCTFDTILSYLRVGDAFLGPQHDTVYLSKLLREAEFYALDDLAREVSKELARRVEDSVQAGPEYEYRSITASEVQSFFANGWEYMGSYRAETAFCKETGYFAKWEGVHYNMCACCGEGIEDYLAFRRHCAFVEEDMIVVRQRSGHAASGILATHPNNTPA